MKTKAPNIFILGLSVFIILVTGQFSNISASLGDAVTIHFTGMSPHVGQNFYLRLVNKGTLKEETRTSLNISNPDFDVVVPVITGHSYFIDFFADLNGNGFYDPPPTDHTWRIDADNVTNNQEFNFAHNTNFTNIDWEYAVTIHFTGMNPHVGQLLELRVENNDTDDEVDRARIDPIATPDFDVTIIGVKLNTEYKVEFYADFSGNGLYDAPAVDHAWLMTFTNTTGDVSLDFAHNTNFTDINWKYLLTVNLSSMNPHLGQLFELRVVKVSDMFEVNRVTLPGILVPNVSVFIPGIELNHDYNIDFYADFNGSGGYNAPPADHAWRLTFNSMNGDFVQEFTHNTNFTDIQWPPLTAIEDNDFSKPDTYNLSQNYPNPFNPSTLINFYLPEAGFVTLKIYNLLGKEVAVLVNDKLDAGNHEVKFNAENLYSGVYFYSLKAGSFKDTKKMILLR